MISENDKSVIMQCAKKYNVSSVIVFGSSLTEGDDAHDIDLGVKGLDPRYFFAFYAELFKYLSKPVDLVDITRKTIYNDLVEESGVRIYG
jgi:predicted nucleotidyltransferase